MSEEKKQKLKEYHKNFKKQKNLSIMIIKQFFNNYLIAHVLYLVKLTEIKA